MNYTKAGDRIRTCEKPTKSGPLKQQHGNNRYPAYTSRSFPSTFSQG